MAREHFTGSTMRDIVRRINGADGITIDQQQQNAMYGVHQVRIRVAGDDRPYRLVLALGDVNLSINESLSGGSLDGHFEHDIAKDFAR